MLTLSPAALAGIKPGDYVLSVDGVRIDAHDESRFAADVQDAIGASTSRSAAARTAAARETIAIRPVNLATERGLALPRLGREPARLRREGRATDGSATCTCRTWAAGSLQQLYVDLDTENRGREGVVVDVRNNNGGFVNPYAIDVFARRGYLQFTPRDFGTGGGRSVRRPTLAGAARRCS